MRANLIIRILAGAACVLISGCSENVSDSKPNHFANGIIGAAVGAGTGALVGSAIANGDVAKSAMLGGGVGLVAGVAVPIAYKYASTEMTISSNASRISKNQRDIAATQKEIDALREQLRAQSMDAEVDEGLIEHVYDGPSLGIAGR